MTACPCCGQPLADGAIVVSLDTNTLSVQGKGSARLTPRQAEVAYVLSKAMPRSLRRDQIVEQVYGLYSDIPESAYNNVRIHVSVLRDRLAALGLTIILVHGAGYRMERIDQCQPTLSNSQKRVGSLRPPRSLSSPMRPPHKLRLPKPCASAAPKHQPA